MPGPGGLRGHPFPGRRTVGAGHARPGGLRGHPSMVRSVGRGLDPSAGGYPGMAVSGSLRGASGTPPPTGCPGDGRRREPAPHPALWGHLPPRGKARAVVGCSASLRGASGTPPLRFARKWAAAGACPSSGPAGPPSPKGEGKGCSGGIHPSRGVGGGGRPRRGGGTPPYGWGYGNAVGFTRTPVSGPPRGRGRACPARRFTRTPVNGSVRREGS